MRLFWAGLLAVALVMTGLARAEMSQAMPRPQVQGSIPPHVWMLTSLPDGSAVADPSRFTVQFMADGTVAIGADCNRAGGVWSGGDGVLDITVTLSTLALCPPEYLDQTFLQALNAVTGYTLNGGTLVLHGATGDMTFTS